MAAEFYFNNNGTQRKSKEVYFNDAGTLRKAKEIWYNDNGTMRKVFQAGLALTLRKHSWGFGSFWNRGFVTDVNYGTINNLNPFSFDAAIFGETGTYNIMQFYVTNGYSPNRVYLTFRKGSTDNVKLGGINSFSVSWKSGSNTGSFQLNWNTVIKGYVVDEGSGPFSPDYVTPFYNAASPMEINLSV